MREVDYSCRDIGYGVEEGVAIGEWGERDWTGKRAFHALNVYGTSPESYDKGIMLYLFDDEVMADQDCTEGWLAMHSETSK